MCSPTLLVTAASAAVSVYSGYQQAAASKRQAEMYDRQASLVQQQGDYNATRARERAMRVIAAQRNAFLANGVDVGSGTPSAVIQDTTRETELDIAAIRYGAAIEATGLGYKASEARSNARSQITGGYINALSPVINSRGTATVLNGRFGY